MFEITSGVFRLSSRWSSTLLVPASIDPQIAMTSCQQLIQARQPLLKSHLCLNSPALRQPASQALLASFQALPALIPHFWLFKPHCRLLQPYIILIAGSPSLNLNISMHSSAFKSAASASF